MTAPEKSRLDKIFSDQSKKKIGIFFTAGYPEYDDTLKIAKILEEAGADFIEIGVPFSDSLVDGTVIQAANQVALNNGLTLEKLFEQLTSLRQLIQIPVILMGGLNPVLQFGVEKFCQRCQEVGIDGVILPELPPVEFKNNYQELFNKYNLENILLIAPNSSPERVREIDELASGFIYVVSSTATTGEMFNTSSNGSEYLKALSRLQLKNPLMVGFGIQDKESFVAATTDAAGGIIGSQMLRVINKFGVNSSDIKQFVSGLRS